MDNELAVLRSRSYEKMWFEGVAVGGRWIKDSDRLSWKCELGEEIVGLIPLGDCPEGF